MRKSAKPRAGRRQETDEAAWRREFKEKFYDLCGGEVETHWLAGLVAMLYPLNADRDPQEAAEVAFMTLGYEWPPDLADAEEPVTLPPPQRRPGLH
ncbi:MAG TPA: hypothetical protein VN280_22475 [Variovorax sp.]|nr:hypothetical protein [Variovorax sp.]